MKKLLVYICSLTIVLMFVSCQTAEKAPPEASKPEKPSVPVSLNLNSKWKLTNKWSVQGLGDIDKSRFEIIQKGAEITWIDITTGRKSIGTLEGNTLHMEPLEFDNSENNRIMLLARKYKISQDGTTMTCEYNFFVRVPAGGSAPGSSTVTCIRE